MANPAKDTGKPVGNFDITPYPQALAMLGEIDIDQWRCIAEFINNSVNGFLNESQNGNDVPDARVDVHIPTSDSKASILQVIDNGPGMAPDQLESAVGNGWTGSNLIDDLELFGMGFNVATARLASSAEVWTTRRGETEWHGLEIDFDKLCRQRHFRTEHLLSPKPDPEHHGTKIKLKKLKPEQRKWLTKSENQAKVRRKLAQAFSPMLEENGKPIEFGLYVNLERVDPQPRATREVHSTSPPISLHPCSQGDSSARPKSL